MHTKKFILILILSFYVLSQTSPIRINQIGYEKDGSKTAVYQSTSSSLNITTFAILDASNQEVYSGEATEAGQVEGWQNMYFWTLDFSEFKEEGTFKIECNGETSFEFEIRKNLYLPRCIQSQLTCFEQMRYTDQADNDIPLVGKDGIEEEVNWKDEIVWMDLYNGSTNMYGGYREASGDASKHLSHLQYANYMSPQETPLLTWALLRSYELNEEVMDSLNLETTLFNEAAWGADYLVNVQADEGWFHTTVFNGWGLFDRMVVSYEVVDVETDSFIFWDTYQSAFREGGGMSIAALAKAANMGVSGDNASQDYLDAAIKGYDHIKTNNTTYCHNGEENIIDDYCALAAAIELYRATTDEEYKTDAGMRVDNIIDKQATEGYFFCDEGRVRPYYHAGEEGLLLLALMYYTEIDAGRDAEIKQAVQKSMDWYRQITEDTNNPFNYVRLFCRPYNYTTGQYTSGRTMFFMPKDSNETGYWYQGENARLASMATAVLNAAALVDDNWQFGTDELSALATDQIHWILGKNPFEMCMLFGFGQVNNPAYSEGQNFVGGICNGITASPDQQSGDGIQWMVVDNSGDEAWRNWRYLEQWLPHEAWYMLATATLSHYVRREQTGTHKPKKTAMLKSTIPDISQKAVHGCVHITVGGNVSEGMILKLVDLKGRVLQSRILHEGVNHIVFTDKDISRGIHIVTLQSEKRNLVREKVLTFQ